ncbi:MAG: NADH-quinone oxidoreductase subunit C [Cyclobacteriaceae bacterium]|jgi:NADH-quinone oxidoreductase subunit C|nr:NADH-quinone oxidoreductase subunit C [Cyclobacteriaceae bacterium]
METPEQNETLTLLTDRFGDNVLSADTRYGILTLSVRQSAITDIIRFLYDHPQLQYRYLTTLCGIHHPELKQIAVMYQLHSLENNRRVRVKIWLAEEKPETPTITDLFAGANWMERETYDFFGVVFTGHPDLRRILNVEDMTIFPLRKEYPLEDQTREDKKDEMFGRPAVVPDANRGTQSAIRSNTVPMDDAQ